MIIYDNKIFCENTRVRPITKMVDLLNYFVAKSRNNVIIWVIIFKLRSMYAS